MSEFAEHLNYSNDVEIAAWGLAANTLAAVNPLGIVSMGTFPSSLVALGRISRWHLDEAVVCVKFCKKGGLVRVGKG